MEKTQAIGYMIMAAKDMGLDKETINKLKIKMEENIDTWTEEFADSEYEGFI
ncbi:hypothetical protein SAMN05446037_1002110 [Anaerovirgula multivorans]|uniref:Uncharacterized protein n=1 Tax=Anaerovirgula multivorans TaxID=312168 RepID=A0A239AL89_9FIRM|nr:hypothetical protein [Anaerovirgula multivorans]SNR96121.1 hypothetical protein SAMN05446037_1002110 [Anaerovirgula multivorans]